MPEPAPGASSVEPRALRFGGFELRPAARVLLADGCRVAIGSRAFDVLWTLIQHRARVLDKRELIELAWQGRPVEENNLTVQISSLRKLLGADAIVTVTGRGYRFTLEPRVVDDPDDSVAAERPRAPATAPAPPPNQPPLFGRDDDIARIAEACRGARLVTVCGPGGIGKTSLTAPLVRTLAPHFEHGSRRLDLTAVREPSLLLPALSQCLGVVQAGQGPAFDELVSALQARRLLLVLDNCEHLLGALPALVHGLLAATDGLQVLATSQEPLHVDGEVVCRLAPLALPPRGGRAPALEFAAVRLFVERVRIQQQGFEAAGSELDDVVEICRRLDGLPHAIELAAGRVPLLGVAGVKSRLGEKLALLSGGLRQPGGRHPTLRAALEWSYQLASPESQVLLRRLALFGGGFSIEGAQQVAGDREGEPVELLAQLGALVDRSLLNVEHRGGRPRFRMLETMREFALERLQEAGELAPWRRRHARALYRVCLLATEQRELGWLRREINDARAALAWALDVPDEAETAIGLATCTALPLAIAGQVAEAVNNLLRVQHRVDDATPPALAARYWRWVGRFGMEGRMPTSRCIEALERARTIFERLGETRSVHGCCRWLAEACIRAGALDDAARHLEHAARCEAAATPPADRMRRLRALALLEDAAGRSAQALRLVDGALQIAETHAFERYCMVLLADLAWIQLRHGEPRAAAERLRQLLRRIDAGRIRNDLARAYALAGLTAALVASEQLAEARAGAPATVAALRAVGIFLAHGDVFAWLAASLGEGQVAAQLLGAADAFHARGETRRERISQHAHRQAQQHVARLLPAAEAEFWALQGRQADEQVLAHLLERCLCGDASAAGR